MDQSNSKHIPKCSRSTRKAVCNSHDSFRIGARLESKSVGEIEKKSFLIHLQVRAFLIFFCCIFLLLPFLVPARWERDTPRREFVSNDVRVSVLASMLEWTHFVFALSDNLLNIFRFILLATDCCPFCPLQFFFLLLLLFFCFFF